MKSRTKMTFKNIFYGYIANIISLVLNFVSRTIFIKMIGTAYLGINGLFTNVLGVLSFAELGIGTALNFSLYKPVAENNKEKIKSIMNLYKMSYRVIAVLIAIIGLILLPFLKFIVKDPGDIGNINIYYLIFLFNTVTGYFVSYKFVMEISVGICSTVCRNKQICSVKIRCVYRHKLDLHGPLRKHTFCRLCL